jgi:D-glycerate 3-kinase
VEERHEVEKTRLRKERWNRSDYPSYELYTEPLREGVFRGADDARGRQLRLVVGSDRRVREVCRL